ncbi:MAG: hypothetical protein KA765_12440 [Thermoflexales bacterium]|nr:hypothetical protein [Thermoflexales bacterium]
MTPRRGPDLFWPIILIGAGVIFLLANLGIIPSNPWPIIWNLWPVILIVVGLDILFGRRSVLGGLIGAVMGLVLIAGLIFLLIAQPNLPGLNVGLGSATLQSRHIEAPLAGIETANVTLEYGSGGYRLYALSDSDKLIDGEVSYYGDLTFDVNASNERANVRVDSHFTGMFFGFMSPDEKWDIGLSAQPTYDLDLNYGSGGGDADLSQLNLSAGRIDGGSGHVNVRLPSTGKFTLNVDGGSGGLTFRVPGKVALRVEYEHGSGGINPGSRLQLVSGDRNRDGVYETENFGSSSNAITLIVNGGSGSINIVDGE